MIYEYLNDEQFLQKLDDLKLRMVYAKLTILDFSENIQAQIQGNITSGSISVTSDSSLRRSLSLSMVANKDNANLMNLDNIISINKKVRVEVGVKNPFKTYSKYGDIIWFPQGTYVISTASLQHSTSSWTISITAKDKMVMLNGFCGGKLPYSVTLHEKYIEQEDGSIIVEYPTITQIIREVVHHFGQEDLNNIFINEVPETAIWLIRYNGHNDIYFNERYTACVFSKQEAEQLWGNEGYFSYSYGDNIGYKETEFTFPGELSFEAGANITDVLDKIVQVLGNYEYFYDVYGRFIFQKIKNYKETASPLTDLDVNNYVKTYSNTKYAYALQNLESVTQIDVRPQYDKIKNDFIVWAQKDTAYAEYHLAIDNKPVLNKALFNMYFNDEKGYYFDSNGPEEDFICGPGEDWREELYREALVRNFLGKPLEYYDRELLAFWRQIYDPSKWIGCWNPDVRNHPENLIYWLDFIDTDSSIGIYNVKNIGRRTQVKNNKDIKAIFLKEPPDIRFIESWETKEIESMIQQGKRYFITNERLNAMLVHSSNTYSAFDDIREMLYQNLSYNISINISCFPKYYLELNNIIKISDKDSGTYGNYIIKSYTLPLTYNGTMSINAIEVLTRI